MTQIFQELNNNELMMIDGGGLFGALALTAAIVIAVACPIAAGATLVLASGAGTAAVTAAIGSAAGTAIFGTGMGVAATTAVIYCANN